MRGEDVEASRSSLYIVRAPHEALSGDAIAEKLKGPTTDPRVIRIFAAVGRPCLLRRHRYLPSVLGFGLGLIGARIAVHPR